MWSMIVTLWRAAARTCVAVCCSVQQCVLCDGVLLCVAAHLFLPHTHKVNEWIAPRSLLQSVAVCNGK